MKGMILTVYTRSKHRSIILNKEGRQRKRFYVCMYVCIFLFIYCMLHY